jgi:type I restriction enzyme S subunit
MSQDLYDLPEGWEWKRLKDVASSIRNTVEPLENNIYHYVGLENIQSNTGVLIDFMPTDGKDISSTKVAFKKDSVLFGKLRPYLNKVYVAEFDGIATTEIIPFQCKELLIPQFLAHYMRSNFFITWTMANCSGARMPRATSKFFDELAYIPLPPLAEQTRIVEKLDAVLSRIDTAIDELQQSLALVDAMFKSGLDQAFNPLGSPSNEDGLYELPEGWEWHLVKDISQNIQYGHTAKATESGNVGFLRITDIQDGMINWSGVPFVEVSEKELAKYELQKNDLVFARSGATAGKSILIDEPPKNMIFASYLIRIISNQLIVFPQYLALFFQSPMYWSIVIQNAAGAAQPNINGTKLGEFSVPLPDISEQQQVVEALNALNKKTTQLKTELTAKIGIFNQLKASVLDGAFRGLIC